MKEKQIWAR